MKNCPFCAIIASDAPATIIHDWPDVIAISPLNPVVPGHILIIPKIHVEDFRVNRVVSALTMACAAELAGAMTGCDVNLITSAGPAATQTVMHLHLHLVPRWPDDGLKLPWSE